MRRSSSASRLQKLGPAIGARLEQTKQFFSGSQGRSSSASGLRKLAPETGSESDDTKQFVPSSSTGGLQKLGPALGDRWDQLRRQIGKASGHRRHRSRSSSRPPLFSSLGSFKEEPSAATDAAVAGKDEGAAPPAVAWPPERDGAPPEGRLASWPRLFADSEEPDVEALQQRVPQEVAKQIDKDVPRTQPRWLDAEGCRVLKRVLSAYAVMNPTVGYCQGMNNIAAVFIMMGFDEATALRGLVSIMQKACPGYHGHGLEGYLRDVAVLEALVRSGRVLPPIIAARLDALEVPLDVLASEHFLSLTARSWPLAAVERTWDLFFQEGSSAVFASFLALLQMYLPADGAEEQPVGGGIPGAVVDLEPVDVFRRAVQRGVSQDLDAILQRVRELIPKVPHALIEKLRDAQCGDGAGVRGAEGLPARHT